jgi:hypothetical protein
MSEKPAKVSFGFITLTPTQKGVFGDNVIAELNEHLLVFPSPDIPIIDLNTANNDLKLKTQQALSGDKEKILLRDASERTWNNLFRKEGQYVERIASGDKLIIAQSGFHSTDTEVQPQPKPNQAVVDAWGNKAKGSIHAEIEPLANVKGIMFIASTIPTNVQTMSIKNKQLRISGDANIQLEAILGTKRKVDFQGLNSGTTYYITAIGFNAAGPGDMSNTIDVVAP